MSQFWFFPRTRSLGVVVVERNSFRFFRADRFARPNGTNGTEKRNEFRSTKKSPQSACQLRTPMSELGRFAPSENVRLTPLLTHQLASTYEDFSATDETRMEHG